MNRQHRPWLLIALPIVLISQIGSAAPDGPTAVQKASSDHLFDCLMDRATQVDDHRSDAETIASAIEDSCSEDRALMEQTFLGQASPAVKARFHAALPRMVHGMAVKAVLMSRKLNSN
jgi:hypothetical protein